MATRKKSTKKAAPAKVTPVADKKDLEALESRAHSLKLDRYDVESQIQSERNRSDLTGEEAMIIVRSLIRLNKDILSVIRINQDNFDIDWLIHEKMSPSDAITYSTQVIRALNKENIEKHKAEIVRFTRSHFNYEFIIEYNKFEEFVLVCSRASISLQSFAELILRHCKASTCVNYLKEFPDDIKYFNTYSLLEKIQGDSGLTHYFDSFISVIKVAKLNDKELNKFADLIGSIDYHYFNHNIFEKLSSFALNDCPQLFKRLESIALKSNKVDFVVDFARAFPGRVSDEVREHIKKLLTPNSDDFVDNLINSKYCHDNPYYNKYMIMHMLHSGIRNPFILR